VRALAARLRDERGSSIVEGLLALGLVALAFAVGAESLLFVETRTLALAAAQAGARAAAQGGEEAGVAAAAQVLAAGGGLGAALAPSIADDGDTLVATVAGRAPAPFPLGIALPAIAASAAAPAERYPQAEAGAG